jgi:hypothetical protein
MELHWRMASRWNLIPFSKFIKLDGEEQSRLVAAYETAMQMEAVQAAEAKKIAKRHGKGNRNGS